MTLPPITIDPNTVSICWFVNHGLRTYSYSAHAKAAMTMWRNYDHPERSEITSVYGVTEDTDFVAVRYAWSPHENKYTPVQRICLGGIK